MKLQRLEKELNKIGTTCMLQYSENIFYLFASNGVIKPLQVFVTTPTQHHVLIEIILYPDA